MTRDDDRLRLKHRRIHRGAVIAEMHDIGLGCRCAQGAGENRETINVSQPLSHAVHGGLHFAELRPWRNYLDIDMQLAKLAKQRLRPDVHACRSVKRVIPHQQNLHRAPRFLSPASKKLFSSLWLDQAPGAHLRYYRCYAANRYPFVI
jgi:hypothetical protein